MWNIKLMSIKKPELIIMVGAPGSGKTFWCSKHCPKNHIIISLDDIREHLFGHQFFEPAEGFILSIGKYMVDILSKQNKNIIVDATNVTPYMRRTWTTIVHNNNIKYSIKIVYLNTNIDICKKRNKKRVKRVPEHIIDRFFNSLIAPTLSECNEIII